MCEGRKMRSLSVLLLGALALGGACDSLPEQLLENGSRRRAVPLDYAQQVRHTKAELESFYNYLDHLSDERSHRDDFEFGLYVDIAKRYYADLPTDEPLFDRRHYRRAGAAHLPDPDAVIAAALANYSFDARERTRDVKDLIHLALLKLQKVNNLVEYNCKKEVDPDSCAYLVTEAAHYLLKRCPAFYHVLQAQEAAHVLSRAVRRYESDVRDGLHTTGAVYYFYSNLPQAAELGSALAKLRSAVEHDTKCEPKHSSFHHG